MGTIYDLVSQDFVQCPYPTLKLMAEQDPVYYDDTVGGWFVTRYQDVRMVARDERFSAGRIDYMTEGTEGELQVKARRVHDYYRGWMIFYDGVEHANFRKALSKALIPHAIERWRPVIEEEAQARLVEVSGAGEAELMGEVISPTTRRVLGLMLGIESLEDLERVTAANDDAFSILQDIQEDQRVAAVQRAYSGVVILQDIFGRLIKERRAGRRAPDILDVMVYPDKSQYQLSDHDIISTCGNIVSGGFGTTSGAIGCALLNLMDNPDQLAIMTSPDADQALVVEETLRWESIALSLVRVAKEDVEVGGQLIPKGSLVFANPGPANRDEAVFDRPQEMDVCRRPNRHLSFGDGPHFCIGAPFARLLMEVLIPRIVKTLGPLTLAAPVEMVGWQSRSPKGLHVSFEPVV